MKSWTETKSGGADLQLRRSGTLTSSRTSARTPPGYAFPLIGLGTLGENGFSRIQGCEGTEQPDQRPEAGEGQLSAWQLDGARFISSRALSVPFCRGSSVSVIGRVSLILEILATVSMKTHHGDDQQQPMSENVAAKGDVLACCRARAELNERRIGCLR